LQQKQGPAWAGQSSGEGRSKTPRLLAQAQYSTHPREPGDCSWGLECVRDVEKPASF